MIDRIIAELEQRPLPPYIVLDVTNVCNLACIHCPQSSRAPGFDKHFLPLPFVEELTAEIERTGLPTLVRVTGDGEPLLHPDIFELLKTLKKSPHSVVNLTTNGVLLDPDKGDDLLNLDLDLIDVSLDALTRQTYEIVRRGGNYARVMRNVFHLLTARAKRSHPMKMMVSFIEQDENASEREGFDAFWSNLVDYPIIRALHSASGAVKNEESARRNRADQKDRGPCPHLWKRLTVGSSGEIKFCAHDWSGDTALGNLKNQSLSEIWTSEPLRELRRTHVAGDIPEDSPCAKCRDWASTAWDWGYERLVDRIVFGNPTLIRSMPKD